MEEIGFSTCNSASEIVELQEGTQFSIFMFDDINWKNRIRCVITLA